MHSRTRCSKLPGGSCSSPERPDPPGRAAQVTAGTAVASRSAQPSPIQYPPSQQNPAPEGIPAVAAATAVRRPGRAAVGAGRPLRDPGRRRRLAPCREDAPVRRPCAPRAPRAVRSRPAHPRPVPREHAQPRRPRTHSCTGRRPRAPAEPVRGGRRDRRTRSSRRAAVPAGRRTRRRQDDLRRARRERGGRPPRCPARARRRRPARRDHDRALVPHHHGAGRQRPGVGGDHLGPSGEGRGPHVGGDHRGRGPCAASNHHEAVEALGEDLRAQHTA